MSIKYTRPSPLPSAAMGFLLFLNAIPGLWADQHGLPDAVVAGTYQAIHWSFSLNAYTPVGWAVTVLSPDPVNATQVRAFAMCATVQ